MEPHFTYSVLGSDFFAKNFSKQNVVFSPFSITSALSMTSAGAEGSTEKELHTALFPNLKETPHAVFEEFTQGTKNSTSFQLANAIFVDTHLNANKGFAELVEKAYNANVEKTDFSSNPDASREKINKWVEDKTKDKIKDLLPKDTINNRTPSVLVNAIYFKADWATKFDPLRTIASDFHKLGSKEKTSVKMMYSQASFGYKAGKIATLVELQYKDPEFSFLIVLPKDNSQEAWDAVVNKDYVALIEKTQKLEKTKMKLHLPKFKLGWKSDMVAVLKEMGIREAFTEKANFNKLIEGQNQFYIGAVIHQAVVEVDEEGTVAAAATAVVMSRKSAVVKEEIVVRVDHPFLFVIRHSNPKTKVNTSLFVGQVMDISE